MTYREPIFSVGDEVEHISAPGNVWIVRSFTLVGETWVYALVQEARSWFGVKEDELTASGSR